MEKPHLPDGPEWAPETVDWFEAWRDSPRTDGWDAAQWQFMFDTAVVHSLVYQSGQFSYLGELRSRLVYMGLEFDHVRPEPKERKATPLDDIVKEAARGPARR